jgi:hypothetical protein
MTCPDCERYKQSAANWRNKAYEAAGHPLPWKPDEEGMKYAISILQAGVLALTRINVKDGRIEELKRAIAILEQNG